MVERMQRGRVWNVKTCKALRACTQSLTAKSEPPKYWESLPRIPKGFVLAIDTREQLPLFASVPPEIIPRQHVTLEHGDYSIIGYETRVTIERKKLSDFYSYIGAERKRTRVKLAALSKMDFAALIIEASESDLNRKFGYGKLTPAHAHGFFVSLRVRHGIHLYISPIREKLEQFVIEHLLKWWEVYNKKP